MANIHINHVQLLRFSADGMSRAVSQAQTAAHAAFHDVIGDQFFALFGRTGFAVDMGFVFLAEVAQCCQNRIWGGLPQPAQGTYLDGFTQLFEQVNILGFAASRNNVFQNGEHLLGSQSARHALATGFFFGEIEEVTGEIDHASFFVHHDHAARTHDCPGCVERVVIHGDVEQFFGNAAAGGAAGLHGFEFAFARHAAADVEDQLAQGNTHRHFDQPGVLDLANQGNRLCAGALLGAVFFEPVSAVFQNQPDAGQRFNIVDDRRFGPQALDRRERRARRGHAAFALNRLDQRGFFTADKSARALFNLDLEIEAGTEDVLPQQAVFFGLGNCQAQAFERQRVFGPAVNDADCCAQRVAGDNHTLDQRVGVAFDQ